MEFVTKVGILRAYAMKDVRNSCGAIKLIKVHHVVVTVIVFQVVWL